MSAYDYQKILEHQQIITKKFTRPKDRDDFYHFLSRDQLQHIVTEQYVRLGFEIANVPCSKDLLNYVLSKARRLFLILILMCGSAGEKISMLSEFMERGVSDQSLPIAFDTNDLKNNVGYSLEATNDQQRFCVSKKWEPNDFMLFKTWQWHLIAPEFGGDDFYFYFSRQRILPFLETASSPASSGFFGEVSRIVVHPAHIKGQDSNSSQGVHVAVKKAKDHKELNRFFDREALNLEKLRDYKSLHLINPIAAYQIDNDRCLMFPWADGGNLIDYWARCKDKNHGVQNLKWIIKQFVGLSDALGMLHADNMRHGDLKPENILWFPDQDGEGTLQIADMGLARFHKIDAHTNIRGATDTPSGTSRYEPPEMDRDRGTEAARSRQYDIWSMGCILLELLIWATYQPEGLSIFRKNTQHFWHNDSPPEGPYRIHGYVEACMNAMEDEFEEVPAQKDILALVRTGLLVVPLYDNNVGQERCRLTANALHKCLNDILKSCVTEPNYLQTKERRVFPHLTVEMNNTLRTRRTHLTVPNGQPSQPIRPPQDTLESFSDIQLAVPAIYGRSDQRQQGLESFDREEVSRLAL